METVYDAFTQGTQLGGLRSKNDIRILLCYILKSLDVPFSKTGLNGILQSTGLANFFEVNDALSALSEDGLLKRLQRDGDEYYELTEGGREVAERLETDLPLQVRKTAVAAAMEALRSDRRQLGTETAIEKLEKGYHVTLTIKDEDTVMMRTVLFAADSLQANAIVEAFRRDPGALYGGIINALDL